MWPLPEPARPETLADGDAGWDPPVLVRLALDHGCDAATPPRPVLPRSASRGPEVRRRAGRG